MIEIDRVEVRSWLCFFNTCLNGSDLKTRAKYNYIRPYLDRICSQGIPEIEYKTDSLIVGLDGHNDTDGEHDNAVNLQMMMIMLIRKGILVAMVVVMTMMLTIVMMFTMIIIFR